MARLLDQEVLLVEALRDFDDAVGLGCVDCLLDPSERACGLVYLTYTGTDDVKMREVLGRRSWMNLETKFFKFPYILSTQSLLTITTLDQLQMMCVIIVLNGYTLLLLYESSDGDGQCSIARQFLRRPADVHEDQPRNCPEDQDPQDQKAVQGVA